MSFEDTIFDDGIDNDDENDNDNDDKFFEVLQMIMENSVFLMREIF